MIVARSFSPPSSSFMGEKSSTDNVGGRLLRQRSKSPMRSTRSPTRPTISPSAALRSEPVQIPGRNVKKPQLQDTGRSAPILVQPKTPALNQTRSQQWKKESAQDLLFATAIPVRRRQGRPSQRLPKGDHVAEFSKFLLDDVQPGKDATLSRNQSLPHNDGLFGNIDELLEGQIIVDSEPLDETTLSARSISSESLASLASPDDYSSSHFEARSSSVGRSPQGRITPRIFLSEDCSRDHPLADPNEPDAISLNSHGSATTTAYSTPSRTTSPPPRTGKKDASRLSFKSTLTSSLKAIKSAARTTILSSSGFGHHGSSGPASLYTNESLLAHNFFDIQPSLTDDRRPPPTMTRPSPELRRYLNPQMASAPPDSPTQLHFWQDERHTYNTKRDVEKMTQKIKQKHRRRRSPGPKSKIDALPSVVALSTCLPPTVRTAHASSPPIWLTPDGEPISKITSRPLLYDPETSAANSSTQKSREPRENRDFLRMYVGEMAMRRNGKLSDDISAGRAKLWLPPLSGFYGVAGVQSSQKPGADRWKAWSIDDTSDD